MNTGRVARELARYKMAYKILWVGLLNKERFVELTYARCSCPSDDEETEANVLRNIR